MFRHHRLSVIRFGISVLLLSGLMLVEPVAHAGVLFAASGQAEPTERESPIPSKDANKSAKGRPIAKMAPVWIPQVRRGAPAARVGGASRAKATPVEIRVLVPRIDEAAVTLSPEPTLHWHLSRSTGFPVNFTLISPETIDPLVDVTLEGPFAAGIQRTPLAAYSVSLEVGKSYQWFVAVVPDSERRSMDIIARGSIRRITPATELERLSRAPVSEAGARQLASAGIWYDALNQLSELLAQKPDSMGVQQMRKTLLLEAGLDLEEEGPLATP